FGGAFRDFPVDLYYVPSHSYLPVLKAMRQNAPQRYLGTANALSYFGFDRRHPLTQDLIARREFAALVHQAFKDVSLADTIVIDNQMIPPGYAGRLPPF